MNNLLLKRFRQKIQLYRSLTLIVHAKMKLFVLTCRKVYSLTEKLKGSNTTLIGIVKNQLSVLNSGQEIYVSSISFQTDRRIFLSMEYPCC